MQKNIDYSSFKFFHLKHNASVISGFNMKLIMRTLTSLITLVILFSALNIFAQQSVGLKTWGYIGSEINNLLYDESYDAEDDYIFLIGPSYSYFFDKDTSVSVNILGGAEGGRKFIEPYNPGDGIETSVDAEEIFQFNNHYVFDFYSTLNRRLLPGITGFIGLKYIADYFTGERYLQEIDNGVRLTEPVQAYMMYEGYGIGTGFAFANHIAGNFYFLPGISYLFKYNSVNLGYSDKTDSAVMLSHGGMAKLGFAYFITQIKSTIEIGGQVQYDRYDLPIEADPRFQDIKNPDISKWGFGPVINITTVF
jgi:hypothetical protein